MTEILDPRVAAFGREVEALCARTGDAGAALDVGATLRLLHDFASTFSLLEDLTMLPDSENLPPSTVGRWAAELMVLTEGVSAAITRERAAALARRTADDRDFHHPLYLRGRRDNLVAAALTRPGVDHGSQ